MGWMRTVWDEFVGLFVDDGALAVAVLVWLAVCWLVLARVASGGWAPFVLFAGLAGILAESAWRGRRR